MLPVWLVHLRPVTGSFTSPLRHVKRKPPDGPHASGSRYMKRYADIIVDVALTVRRVRPALACVRRRRGGGVCERVRETRGRD